LRKAPIGAVWRPASGAAQGSGRFARLEALSACLPGLMQRQGKTLPALPKELL